MQYAICNMQYTYAYAICSPLSSYSDILAETGLQATHRLSQVLMQQSVRFPTKIIHRFICTRWHPSVKKFYHFCRRLWPLGHLGKQQQYEGENLVKHDDPTSIFPWQRKYFPLYFLKFYSTVVLFIVPLSAKLSALPVLVLALVLVLVHVLILVLVLWLIPMQSSHLPSALPLGPTWTAANFMLLWTLTHPL